MAQVCSIGSIDTPVIEIAKELDRQIVAAAQE